MPSLDLGPVVGPQGEQGATGAQGIRGEQGLPGPNQVTNSTATPLTGVLVGNGSVVGVANIDEAPTADSTGFAQSGGTDKAIKTRVPVIGMGNNLLRNWYFGNPVNQRGQSSYSGQKYGIDGWKTTGDNSAVITINGGSITFAPSQSQSYFVQGLMDYVIPLGRTATISALIDGDLWATSFAIPSTRPEANAVIGRYNKGNDGYIALVTDANADYQFQMRSPGITRTLYAFKLELGSEQTLCHNEGTAEAPVWVLNEIPDYEYELYRCITSTADSTDTYANKTLATGQEIAYVENGTTASRAYAAGEYFCWHGALYKAKTAIGNGDTFTENTNCEQATGGGFNNVTKPIDIKSECVVNDSVLVANNLQVTLIGRVLLISGNTYRDINGTNITVITLPSRLGNAKKAYFYVGGYGGSFVGEGYVQNQTVVMNISSSSNNGVFNVMTTI